MSYSILILFLSQKNFPNGIDILTAADYFSLGNRTDAYTSIALHIAKYEEYRQPIIKHLYMSKLSHWDPTIRKLASKSFQLLAPLDWRFICSEVLPYLLDSSLDSYVQIRHGAVLGVAEIVLSFSDIKEEVQTPDLLSSALVDSIAQLVPTIEKKRLYRGKGGEQMRAAVCRFIECLSIARVPLTVPQQVRLLDSLDACIPHPSEDIQEQACKALSALMRSYFPVGAKGPSDRLQKRVVDKYAKEVRTSINPAATRGFSLALGHLPAKLLAPSPRVVDITLSCLCRSSRPDALVGKEKDAETRRNALVSLAKVCTEIGILPREDDVTCIVGISAKQMEHVFKAFFNAIGDYNVERRGDVGSWSRIKAMDGLEALVMLIASEGMSESSEYFTRDICSRVFGSLLKQMSEKLDAVRAHAAGCLLRLLSASNPGVPLVPAKERLCEIFLARDDSVINWADASKSFPMLLEAATIEEYFDSIISGLIISVGCLTESVSKSATRALLQNVKELDVQFTKNLGRVFLELFSKHQKEGRVTLPLLKTISILLDHMCMDPLLKDHVFTSSLLDNLKEEESGCNDVPRLFEITKVLLGCLQGKDIQKDVLALICQLLSHRFPRVRRYAAENLYVALLEHPDILGSVTVAEDHPIMEMLLNDPWDSEMDESTLESLAKNVSERLRIEVTP
jgi:tubulin-specific chaperone D